jgi:hypothetical protein
MLLEFYACTQVSAAILLYNLLWCLQESMHINELKCLVGCSDEWCFSDVGGDLGLLWCVENKHLLIDLLIRTETCWFALFGQWCKGWGKYWIRTDINLIWFLPCDESSIAPLCQPITTQKFVSTFNPIPMAKFWTKIKISIHMHVCMIQKSCLLYECMCC